MRGFPWSTPQLDFIVIGAQKAGTTSLWRYLEDNPALVMPQHKEAPFFSEPGYPDLLREYMRNLFRDAPRSARLGKVTPSYMLGVPGISVTTIADRIRATAPGVRLIALLRDPVERAFSAYRMEVRDSGERRSFSAAIAEQLEPAALERARAGPGATDSYVVGGEYGRMLEAYRERFGREQLHVELTADLERSPADVVPRVCEFIGVPVHEPAQLGRRFFPGGARLLAPEAEADLLGYLDRHVWPHVRHGRTNRERFEFWFRLWNTEPERSAERPDEQTVARLRAHYAADAPRLEAVTGIRAPWPLG